MLQQKYLFFLEALANAPSDHLAESKAGPRYANHAYNFFSLHKLFDIFFESARMERKLGLKRILSTSNTNIGKYKYKLYIYIYKYTVKYA